MKISKTKCAIMELRDEYERRSKIAFDDKEKISARLNIGGDHFLEIAHAVLRERKLIYDAIIHQLNMILIGDKNV